MPNKKNIISCDNNYDLENEKIINSKEPGIHPDTIIGIFKAKDIREGMTIAGKHISGILKFKNMTQFILIKKDAFSANIPSKDIILSPYHKIKFNGIEKKVESFINGDNITKVSLPSTTAYHLLTNKKDYICVQNLYVACGNENKYKNENESYTGYNR
jgi:hypothetical protein